MHRDLTSAMHRTEQIGRGEQRSTRGGELRTDAQLARPERTTSYGIPHIYMKVLGQVGS